MEASSLVQNAGRLIDVMGYWPSFHDANVMSVERGDDSLRLRIHVFAMTDRLDPAGYYELEKHHLATLAFEGISSSAVPTDYQSDCLDRLWFEQSGTLVHAHIESHLDLGGDILCSRASVQDIVPCSSDGTPLGA
jgi:hypothetical protein